MSILTRKAVFVQGAIAAYLAPKMAQDAKLDLRPILDGVTSANFASKKPSIITAVRKAKLAKDANIEDFATLLDACEKQEIAEGADIDPNSALPMSAEEMKKKADDAALADKAAKDEKVKNFRDSLSEDQRKGFDECMDKPAAGDEGETDEDKAKREKADADKKKAAEDAAKPPGITKSAMDAAIESAVKTTRRTMEEISLAKDDVQQYVGKLAAVLAFDSAADVYGAALKAKGIAVDGVHPSAFKAILHQHPKLGDTPASTRLAQDADVDAGGFTSRYGDLLKVA